MRRIGAATFPTSRRQPALQRQDSVACRWKKWCVVSMSKTSTQCIGTYELARPIVLFAQSSRQLGIAGATVPALFRLRSRSAPSTKSSATATSTHMFAASAPAPASNCSIAAKDFIAPIELLRGGGVIGILGDQHAGDHGLWTPFFGRLASTSPLPALLAKRTGAALSSAQLSIPMDAARWRMVFTPRFDSAGDSVETLTGESERNDRATNSRRAGRLVLGSQPMENAEAEFPAHALQTRNFCAAGIANRLKPFRILIRAPNWLGDSIISIPAVRAIKVRPARCACHRCRAGKNRAGLEIGARSRRGPADSAKIACWQRHEF